MFELVLRKKATKSSDVFGNSIKVTGFDSIVETSVFVDTAEIGDFIFELNKKTKEVTIKPSKSKAKASFNGTITIASGDPNKERPGGSGSGGELPPPKVIIEG